MPLKPTAIITITVLNANSEGTPEILNIIAGNIIAFKDFTIITAQRKFIKTDLTAAQIEMLIT